MNRLTETAVIRHQPAIAIILSNATCDCAGNARSDTKKKLYSLDEYIRKVWAYTDGVTAFLEYRREKEEFEFLKKHNPHLVSRQGLCYGGSGGIRTHVPSRTTAFRVRLVATTSIRFHSSSIIKHFHGQSQEKPHRPLDLTFGQIDIMNNFLTNLTNYLKKN